MSIQKNLFFVTEILRYVELKNLINFEDFLIADEGPTIHYLFNEAETQRLKALIASFELEQPFPSIQEAVFFIIKQDLKKNEKSKKKIPAYYKKPERLCFFSDLSPKVRELYVAFICSEVRETADLIKAFEVQGEEFKASSGYSNITLLLYKIFSGSFFCNPYNERVVQKARSLISLAFEYAEPAIFVEKKELYNLLQESYSNLEFLNNPLLALKRIRMLKTFKNSQRGSTRSLLNSITRIRELCREPSKLHLLTRTKTLVAVLTKNHPLFFFPQFEIIFPSELEDLIKRKHSLLEIQDAIEDLADNLEASEDKLFEKNSLVNFMEVDKMYDLCAVEIDGFFEAVIERLYALKVNYFSFSGIFDCFYDKNIVFLTTIIPRQGLACFTFQDLEILEFSISQLICTFACLSVQYSKRECTQVFSRTLDFLKVIAFEDSFDINALSLFFKDLEGVILDQWCTNSEKTTFFPDIFLNSLLNKHCLDFFNFISIFFRDTAPKTDIFSSSGQNVYQDYLSSCMVATRFFRWIPPRKYEETSMMKECVRSFSQMGTYQLKDVEKLRTAVTYVFLRFFLSVTGTMPGSFISFAKTSVEPDNLEAVLAGKFLDLNHYSYYSFKGEGKKLFTNDCFNEKDARNVPNDTGTEKGSFDKQDLYQKREYLYFSQVSHEDEVQILEQVVDSKEELVSRLSMKPEPKDSGRPFGMEPVCVRNFNSVVQNNLFKVTSIITGSLLSRSINSKLEIIQKALALMNENKILGFKTLFLMTDFNKFGNSIPFEVTQVINEVASEFYGEPLIKSYLKVIKRYIHIAKFGNSEARIDNPFFCDNQGQRNGAWQLMLSAAPYFLLDEVYDQFPKVLSRNVPIFPIFFEDDHMFVIPFHNSFLKAKVEHKTEQLLKQHGGPNLITDTEEKEETGGLIDEDKLKKRVLRLVNKQEKTDIAYEICKKEVIQELSSMLLQPIATGYQRIGLKMQDDKCTFSMTRFSLLGDAFTKDGIFVQPFKAIQNFLRKSDRLADSWHNLISDSVSISSSNSLAGNHPSYSWLVSFILLPFKTWLTDSVFLTNRSLGLYLALFCPPSLGFASFPCPQTNAPGVYSFRDIDYFYLLWFHKDNVNQPLFSFLARNIITKCLDKTYEKCKTATLDLNKDVLKSELKKVLSKMLGFKDTITEESKKLYCKVLEAVNFTPCTFREHLKTMLPNAQFKKLVSKVCTSASACDLVSSAERIRLTRSVFKNHRQDLTKHFLLLNFNPNNYNTMSLGKFLCHCFHFEDYFLYTRPSYSMLEKTKTRHTFGGVFLLKKRVKKKFDFISFGNRPSSNFSTNPIILNELESKIISLNDIAFSNPNEDVTQKEKLANFLFDTFGVPSLSAYITQNKRLKIFRDLNGLQITAPIHICWSPAIARSHYVCLHELDELKMGKRRVLNYGLLQFLCFLKNDLFSKFKIYKNTAWRDQSLFLTSNTDIKPSKVQKVSSRLNAILTLKKSRPVAESIKKIEETNLFGIEDGLKVFEEQKMESISKIKQMRVEQDSLKKMQDKLHLLHLALTRKGPNPKKNDIQKEFDSLKFQIDETRKKICFINLIYSSPVLDLMNFKLIDFQIPTTKSTKKIISKKLFETFIANIMLRVHRTMHLQEKSFSALINSIPISHFSLSLNRADLDTLQLVLQPTVEECSEFLSLLKAQDCLDVTLDWMQHHWEFVVIGKRYAVTEKTEFKTLSEFIQVFISRSRNIVLSLVKQIHSGLIFNTLERIPDLYVLTWMDRYKSQLIERIVVKDWVQRTNQKFTQDLENAMSHGIFCYAALTDFFTIIFEAKTFVNIDKYFIKDLADDLKRICFYTANFKFNKNKNTMDAIFASLPLQERAKVLGILFALKKLIPFFLDFKLDYNQEEIVSEPRNIKYLKKGYLSPIEQKQMIFSESELHKSIKPSQLPTNIFNELNNSEKYFQAFQGQENKMSEVARSNKQEKTIFKPERLDIIVPVFKNPQAKQMPLNSLKLENMKLKEESIYISMVSDTIKNVENIIKHLNNESVKLENYLQQILEEGKEDEIEQQVEIIENKQKDLREKIIFHRRVLANERKKAYDAKDYSTRLKNLGPLNEEPKIEVTLEQTTQLALLLPDISLQKKKPELSEAQIFDMSLETSRNLDILLEQQNLPLTIPNTQEITIEKVEEKSIPIPPEPVKVTQETEPIVTISEKKPTEKQLSTQEKKKETVQSVESAGTKNTIVLFEGTHTLVVEKITFISNEPLQVVFFGNEFYVCPTSLKVSKIKPTFLKTLTGPYKEARKITL